MQYIGGLFEWIEDEFWGNWTRFKKAVDHAGLNSKKPVDLMATFLEIV